MVNTVVVVKMGRSLSIIKRCSAFLTTLSTRQVLQALVLSHLDYCSVVWSGATKKDLGNCNWLRTGQHGWPLDVHRELLIICMPISPGWKWRKDWLHHFFYLWEVLTCWMHRAVCLNYWHTFGHPCIPHKTCHKRFLHSPQVQNRLWEAHHST